MPTIDRREMDFEQLHHDELKQLESLNRQLGELHEVGEHLSAMESTMKYRSGMALTILTFNVILTITEIILIAMIPYLI